MSACAIALLQPAAFADHLIQYPAEPEGFGAAGRLGRMVMNCLFASADFLHPPSNVAAPGVV